ncbi:MAG TPA: hypothetical protein VK457_01365 [Chloroflexota bacterium]|nr:hypothetical protein [Chloroflexota bacterium]
MWTKPGLARALRQQSMAHRRRNFIFTPAPLPPHLERPAAAEASPKAEPRRPSIQTEVVLSD